MSHPETIVEKQLTAYNQGDYENFASCYHEAIVSYDIHSGETNPKMCGSHFFNHYRAKFLENPKLNCHVTSRMTHGDLVIDKELISDYRDQQHTELVIYEVKSGLITKMWFTQELPVKT